MTKDTDIVVFKYQPDKPIQSMSNIEALLSIGKENLGDLIPMDADVDRLIAEVKAAASENHKICSCSQVSIARAAGRAAITGLHIGGPMKQADIIPRYVKNDQGKKVLTACFEPRYGGLIYLACKSGMIKAVEPHVIYSEEQWDIDYGTNGKGVTHKPKLVGDRGQMIAAYVVITTEGGHQQTQHLRADQIKKRENVSKAKYEGRPWKQWAEEMWNKTVVKYGLNYAPISSENMALMEAIAADNEAHGIDIQEPKEGEKGSEILKAAEGLPPEAADAARQAAAEHEDVVDVESTPTT